MGLLEECLTHTGGRDWSPQPDAAQGCANLGLIIHKKMATRLLTPKSAAGHCISDPMFHSVCTPVITGPCWVSFISEPPGYAVSPAILPLAFPFQISQAVRDPGLLIPLLFILKTSTELLILASTTNKPEIGPYLKGLGEVFQILDYFRP